MVAIADRLRVACDPASECEDGYHKHYCSDCKIAWKHSQTLIDALNKEEHRLAHTCPSCGRRCGYKYHSEDNPCECDFSIPNKLELPTFAIANLVIKYKQGFEVKTFEMDVITEERCLNDKAYMHNKCIESLRTNGIEFDSVVSCEATALIVPPPEDLTLEDIL